MAEALALEVGKSLAVDAAKMLTQLVAGRALEEIRLAWGFKDQLEKLRNKFMYIQAFLEDANSSKHAEKSHLVSLWLKKVKDVAYLAEDVMDEYAFEILRRKLELKHFSFKKKFRSFFKTSSNPVFFRLRMSSKVSEILSMFDELNKEAREIGLNHAEIARNALAAGASCNDDDIVKLSEARQHAAVGASDFVGRKHDEEKLIGMLCHPCHQERDISTIAIVGMGGLGKTTLARRLYDHEKVGTYFGNNTLWICVSKNFDIRRILNEMVESVTSRKGDLSNTDAIIRKLQEELKEKRFLLVLDDVWNEDQELWDPLKGSLQRIGGLSGSVILITTRSNKVAKVAQSVSTHSLKELSEEDSWVLLKQKAFNNRTLPNISCLEDVGRRIAGKCKGVPLALKVIGGLLHSREQPYEWESIDRSELWALPQGRNQILPSLLLSYNHLPSPCLKQCLAYCAIFPKDFLMEKNRLITLWLAQGFLHKSDTRKSSLEETGEEYLRILLNNSLLQEEEVEECEDYYSMHDLVHDLAVYVSGDDLLINAVEDQRDKENCRHLVFTSGRKTLSEFSPENTLRKLRTLSFFRARPLNLLIHARYLRTLMIIDTGITEVPPAVGLLKHLRYLDLSYNPIITLPDSIGKLYQLQTLRLRNCGNMTKLPKFLDKLISLRHICTTTLMFASRGLAQLTNLQTLPCLTLDDDGEGWSIDELGDLHELKGEIIIDGLEHLKNKETAKKAGLGTKPLVSKLMLFWAEERGGTSSVYDEDVLDGLQPHPNIMSLELHNFDGDKFPLWIMRMAVTTAEQGVNPRPLINLTVVKLLNCSRCQVLPTMGHLPALRCLILGGFDVMCIGNEFYTSDHDISIRQTCSNTRTANDYHVPALEAFQSLRELEVFGFQRLDTWMLPPQAVVPAVFPCLEVLRVRDCPRLEVVPNMDIQSLRSLEFEELGSIQSLDIFKYTSALTSLSVGGMPSITNLPQELSNCRKLQKLEIKNFKKLILLPSGLQSLVSLQILCVEWCPGLTSLPDDLLHGLSSLRELSIFRCQGLTRMPSSLLGSTSLEKLSIIGCPSVEASPVAGSTILPGLLELNIDRNSGAFTKSMIEAVQYFPRLWKLVIGGFRDEDEFKDYFSDMTPLLRSQSLTDLLLFGEANIKSLPEQLQLLTGIKALIIARFADIEEIPEWIENMSSLELLRFWRCEKVKFLPPKKAMERLNYLEIEKCPLLAERCARDNGPEWHKVSHVPLIKIDDEEIENV